MTRNCPIFSAKPVPDPSFLLFRIIRIIRLSTPFFTDPTHQPMPNPLFARLGLSDLNSGAAYGQWITEPGGDEIASVNPADGKPIARVRTASRADYDKIVEQSQQAFTSWRMVPAPQRGEVVRKLGNALREAKDDLG